MNAETFYEKARTLLTLVTWGRRFKRGYTVYGARRKQRVTKPPRENPLGTPT